MVNGTDGGKMTLNGLGKKGMRGGEGGIRRSPSFALISSTLALIRHHSTQLPIELLRTRLQELNN